MWIRASLVVRLSLTTLVDASVTNSSKLFNQTSLTHSRTWSR